MYISRMPLNLARFDAKRLVGSPYRMHAAVESSFPPDSARVTEEGRVLWRIDYSEADHSAWLYVVSPDRPDFSHIIEQAGWPTHMQWETTDYSQLLNRIAIGQQWQFRLRANPARKAATDRVKDSPRKPEEIIGKRQAFVTANQQMEWLMKRSDQNGFTVLQEECGPALRVVQRQKERFERNGATVTLATAVFKGQLEVTDAEALRRALCHGIGHAKGFGCGLLTLSPIHTSLSR